MHNTGVVMSVIRSVSPVTYGLVVIASVGLISPVAAQRAALEEVTVTARKTEESILEVPLSVTAFNEIELERQNIVAMEDLAQWTPALQFQDVNGTFQNPAIRGLAQTDQISPIGNVGVFLDGVPLSNRSGLEFGMLDLARIEVVKGPQSAPLRPQQFRRLDQLRHQAGRSRRPERPPGAHGRHRGALLSAGHRERAARQNGSLEIVRRCVRV